MSRPGFGRHSATPTRADQMNSVAAFPRLNSAQKELDEGRFESASALVIQHLRENRNEPRGLALLGAIAMKTGALVQAEQFLRQAIMLGNRSLEVQRDMASTINQQERPQDALKMFTALQRHHPDPQIRATRAHILDKLGRTEEALKEYEELIAIKPDDTQFLVAYGNSLRSAGKTDEAIATLRRAIAIDAERGEAWWALANIKSKVLTDDDISTMEEQLKIAVDALNIIPIHFALGRAFHDRKSYEKAFHHFSEGNRLRAGTIDYSANDLTDEVNEVIRTFDVSFFRPAPATESSEPIPIFLISMPRAGSTLLEQMLDQHPDIQAVGELPYLRALVRSALEIHTRRGPVKVPELVAKMIPDEAAAYGEDYLERASLHWNGRPRYFIDKMPMNWSDVPFIRRVLPQARFIEIRRDAMDCCFSNFIHYFSRAHASSFSLRDIGRSYVDYARMLDHIRAVAPDLICHVVYEDLVEQPERELRRVLNYLDLPWDESLLRFYESDRTVRTPSAEQVRRPLNRSGIGGWKPYEEWLGPLREALGPVASS